MSDLRQHIRTAMVCQIKIMSDDLGTILVKTRDISDGGTFVVLDAEKKLPIGSFVKGEVQGLVGDAPVLNMEVVRLEPTGVGLKFV